MCVVCWKFYPEYWALNNCIEPCSTKRWKIVCIARDELKIIVIWFYAVCKSPLLSHMAVKDLNQWIEKKKKKKLFCAWVVTTKHFALTHESLQIYFFCVKRRSKMTFWRMSKAEKIFQMLMLSERAASASFKGLRYEPVGYRTHSLVVGKRTFYQLNHSDPNTLVSSCQLLSYIHWMPSILLNLNIRTNLLTTTAADDMYFFFLLFFF